MSKLVLVVFPDEAKACEEFLALAELHREAGAGVRGAVVVRRDGNGSPSIGERSGAPPGVGTLVGALRNELLEAVERELRPEAFAVIAEISEPSESRAIRRRFDVAAPARRGFLRRQRGTIHFVNSHDVHDALIAIDAWVFGVQPTVWAQRFYHPVLSDVFSLAYMNYFVISVVVVGWLLLEGRRAEMREALLGTVLSFYTGYVLYVLFPAAPPRLTLASQFVRDFSGSWLTAVQLRMVEISPTSSRGAFPSLHCAVTLITVMYAYRFRRLLFWIVLGPAILLVLATVYLRHHYVVDIAAGFLLAVVVHAITPRVAEAWARLQARAAAEDAAPASDLAEAEG